MRWHLKIGTRKSPLAQWQAKWVADRLQRKGVETELVLIKTAGDRMLNVGIPEIGTKGVFTEDLESKLATGEIDLAVHSAKDMPSHLPGGFELIAFTRREQAHDVVVSTTGEFNWSSARKVGTSSARRAALIRHYYPHIELNPVRGNVQTRISKLDKGELDALILAYAGVHRMQLDHLIQCHLPMDQFVPAVGQGSLAIEVSAELNEKKKQLLRETLNHPESWSCISCERAFLRQLEGGCSIPAYAYAVIQEETIKLRCGIISLDGSKKLDISRQDSALNTTALGTALAKELLKEGGSEILGEIKQKLK